MENEKFIVDEAPGICNQEDFDHDFKLLLKFISSKDQAMCLRAYTLIRLAVDKSYELHW